MTRLAMGLHVQGAYEAAEHYLRAVKPPVVKFLDDAPPHLVAIVNGYGGLSILRVYRQDQDPGNVGEYLKDIEHAANGSAVKAIEVSHNEAHQAGDDLTVKAELDIAGMKLAERLGKIGVIGCFSVGMPDLPDWPRYRPALEYAAAHGHLLALHEYGGGSLGMDAGITGNGKDARGWYCLRYRKVLDWARSIGLTMPKIVITEAGIDDLSPGVMPKTRGYQTARELHPPSVGDYATQAARYARHLAEDWPAVVGWVDFGFGAADPAWHAFDLSRDPAMLHRMIAEMIALPDTAPAPKPPKEDPTMTFTDHLTRILGGRLVDERQALPDVVSPKYGSFGGRNLSAITTIAVHHTAGPKDQTAAQVYAFHTGPERQWAGIGYHLLIRRGEVHYVGDVATARACVADLNPSVICVCLTGDYTKETVDLTDSEALRLTVDAIQSWAQVALGRRLAIKGHGELPGQSTACPGGNLLPLVHELAAHGGPGLPPSLPPVVGKPNLGKIAWFAEDVERRMKAEGLVSEAAYWRKTVTAFAIKARDAR